MSLSKKVSQDIKTTSWIRVMWEEGLKLKAKYGEENVFDFSLGEPAMAPPPSILQALQKVAVEKIPRAHGYMQNAGFPEVREKIAKDISEQYSLPFKKDHIIMTWGSSGAMNVILKSLINSGDEIIVVAPIFQEYIPWISNCGGKIVISMTKSDWTADINDIERKININTKAIIINSPCNPSGRLFRGNLLKNLSNLLHEKSRKFGDAIFLISDEPYKKIIFDGLKFIPPVQYYENTIIASSFSKDFAIGGERIGYMAVHPYCAYGLDIVEHDIFLNRTLGFVNAPAIMQRMLLHFKDVQIDIKPYQHKRDLLYNALTSIGFDIVKPDGTFYMFPRSPIEDDVEWVKILKNELILTTPGIIFSCPGYFRIAFCMPDHVIEKSIPAFKRVIDRVKG